jgi:hypothetical protein
VARLLAGRPELWERYDGWLASLHPAAFEEVENMAKGTRQRFRIDLEPLVKSMGLERVIEQLGAKRVIEHLGLRRVIKEAGGVEQLWAQLTPEERRQLKRLAQE